MIGDCKTCAAYKAQVEYLQGLLDRTLAQIAPVPEKEAPEKPEKVEENKEIFGEG